MNQKDFTDPFVDFFTIFSNMILIVARQEVSNFDNSVVVHELELRLARVGRPKTSLSPPAIVLLAVPKRLLSDFRCGVPLFIVILVIYKHKNR